MNKLQQKFQDKKENLLTVYFTAGYPELNDTATIIKELEASGADIIEVGMPFSDPVADGPTIQESDLKALQNGMSIKKLLEQLKAIKGEVNIPILLMGYINPIWKFGLEKFLKTCEESGVSGLILPDIPLNEFVKDFKPLYDKYNLSNVFLITPQTTDERIRAYDEACNGFIYMVSSASTTGSNKSVDEEKQMVYFNRVKSLGLKNPTQIGFNIKDKASFDRACSFANGGIIGSAFIKKLIEEGDLKMKVREFVKSIR
ncbi:MAG TPA: tryptophan synthase subunit alpha [Prolixibacteraceae bacterium]|nr:tryptophan synthase subunit alpha [Prolixibacteraceae bacterium]HPS11939.1 tryptophan synthase subunit alpha [Prolixibacteraceae bacterium]